MMKSPDLKARKLTFESPKIDDEPQAKPHSSSSSSTAPSPVGNIDGKTLSIESLSDFPASTLHHLKDVDLNAKFEQFCSNHEVPMEPDDPNDEGEGHAVKAYRMAAFEANAAWHPVRYRQERLESFKIEKRKIIKQILSCESVKTNRGKSTMEQYQTKLEIIDKAIEAEKKAFDEVNSFYDKRDIAFRKARNEYRVHLATTQFSGLSMADSTSKPSPSTSLRSPSPGPSILRTSNLSSPPGGNRRGRSRSRARAPTPNGKENDARRTRSRSVSFSKDPPEKRVYQSEGGGTSSPFRKLQPNQCAHRSHLRGPITFETLVRWSCGTPKNQQRAQSYVKGATLQDLQRTFSNGDLLADQVDEGLDVLRKGEFLQNPHCRAKSIPVLEENEEYRRLALKKLLGVVSYDDTDPFFKG